MKTIIKIINIIIFNAPLLFVISFCSFLLRIWIVTGKRPGFGALDPKEFGFIHHMGFVDLSLRLTVYATIIGFVLFVVSLITKHYSISKFHLYIFFFAGVLNAILLFFDPGSYIEWYLD